MIAPQIFNALIFVVSSVVGIARIFGVTNRFYVDFAHMWICGMLGAAAIAYWLYPHRLANLTTSTVSIEVLWSRVLLLSLSLTLGALEIACFLLGVGH